MNGLRECSWMSLCDGIVLRRSVPAVKYLSDPSRSTSIPFRSALEKDAHLLIPTVLHEGGERALGDAVRGGGGRQLC